MTAPLRSIDRRAFLMAMPAIAVTPGLAAQSAKPLVRVRTFNHVALSVSDPQDSIDFYQGLFGLPIQARHGSTALLRIGSGPQFMAIGPANGAPPGISHLCLGVENFDAYDLVTTLEAHGLTKADGPGGGLSGGPLKIRVRLRGPEAGGSLDGTPHMYFGDPDGIVVQLQHPSYCGGASVLGNLCDAPEPADRRPLLVPRELGHLTMRVSDAQRSNAFYQQVFGGVQFLTFAAAGSTQATATPAGSSAGVDHVALTIENFDPDRVLKVLEGYGIKSREGAQRAQGPLTHFTRPRLEARADDRRGPKADTPELYFTDPDGILIELQDRGAVQR